MICKVWDNSKDALNKRANDRRFKTIAKVSKEAEEETVKLPVVIEDEEEEGE